MASGGSPTSVTEAVASSPGKEGSMAKRLVRGSFLPSKTASQKMEDVDAPEIFVNEEEEETTDEENIDLSVVRGLLGDTFKLDKDTKESTRVVSFSGVDTPDSSKGDDAKSNGELLAKITRLELKLKQAELDCSAEKARRKKSSRSTIKLAKEINKRTVEATAQQKAIEQLTTANATLDTKLSATRRELDERITAFMENDRRMAEMTKLHNEEVDNLRRQLSAANSDLDLLRGKLVSLEVKEAERIAEHTVYTGIDPTEAKRRIIKKQKKQKKNFAISLVVLLVGWFYQRTAFSMDAICGPAVPGTLLNKESTYEAPWFAPGSLKQTAFGICGDRKRVSMSWTSKGGDVGRFYVETLDEKKPKTLLDRTVLTAEVKFDRLDIMEKKGKLESVKLPWSA